MPLLCITDVHLKGCCKAARRVIHTLFNVYILPFKLMNCVRQHIQNESAVIVSLSMKEQVLRYFSLVQCDIQGIFICMLGYILVQLDCSSLSMCIWVQLTLHCMALLDTFSHCVLSTNYNAGHDIQYFTEVSTHLTFL